MAKLNAEELITVFEHYSKHDFDPTGAELDNAIEVLRSLSSEGAVKDAVVEAARQYLKLNEHYASVGKTQLRDAIAELDFVSEGLTTKEKTDGR